MKTKYPALQVCGSDDLRRGCRFQAKFEFENTEALKASANQIDDACSTFASAGSHGAFETSQRSGTRPSFIYEDALARGTSILALFSTSGMDYRAFHFLRNMLDRTPAYDMTLKSISIAADGFRESEALLLPEIDQLNESDQYPRVVLSPDIPSFISESTDFSKSRRAIVEFREPLRQDSFSALQRCTDAWYLLLEKGAFSKPFGSAFEAESIRGNLSRYDETSYEIHVSRYIVSEIGFKILANMLKHLSRYVSPVVQIEID